MAVDEPVLETARRPDVLLRRGRILEGITLAGTWPALSCWRWRRWRPGRWRRLGSAWISLIEIGASTVVLWELSGSGQDRQRRALRLIGGAFVALAAYLMIQSVLVLASGYRPGPSGPGITWTALTAAAMFALAAGKARTGRALATRSW